MLKVEYKAIREGDKTISHERAFVWAAISRNLSANVNSGMSPSMAMLGRSALLESLEARTMPPLGVEMNPAAKEQIASVARARGKVMESDSKNTTRLSLTRPLRANPNESFAPQDTIRVFQRLGSQKSARWHIGYRVLSSTGRHIVDERGNRLVKILAHQARIAKSLLGQEMQAVTPTTPAIIPTIVPANGVEARPDATPVLGGLGANNSNSNVTGSSNDALTSGVHGVWNEGMRKQHRILVGGYGEAVDELEMSQWDAQVPLIYHSTWECWSTGHDEGGDWSEM